MIDILKSNGGGGVGAPEPPSPTHLEIPYLEALSYLENLSALFSLLLISDLP